MYLLVSFFIHLKLIITILKKENMIKPNPNDEFLTFFFFFFVKKID